MPARVLKMRRPEAQPARTVVLYARVSSKEQEQEGFSIPAQLRLLREYAAQKGYTVAEEFIDVETAKRSGRIGFTSMVAFVRKNNSRTVLVEKTDRLYRNIKDWVTLDELALELHFVKEGVILSPDSRSSDKFMHGMKVLMAKNYIDNLSEETRKGMIEKARSGLWPSCAPVGYTNTIASDAKRIITPDPITAPVITQLFDWFATGQCSLLTLSAKARKAGLSLGSGKLHKSEVHQILRKRLYSGDFDWDGVTYRGTHTALVTKAVWERVQELLNAKAHPRKHKHDFPYSGILTCGHCGCSMVAEIKKGRYVYYHCTGGKGTRCPEPYTREERLTQEITTVLAARGRSRCFSRAELQAHHLIYTRICRQYGVLRSTLRRKVIRFLP
jgi:site-specific DNA recombinase